VNDRLHVVLYSCKHDKEAKRIEFYISKSNLGFFRLCFKSSTSEMYDKAFNYVSTTFINLELQKFIFDNIKNYSLVDRIKTIQCPVIGKSDLELHNRLTINSDDYISQNPVFLMFDKIFPLVYSLTNFEETFDKNIGVYYEKFMNKTLSHNERFIFREIAKSFIKIKKSIEPEKNSEYLILMKSLFEDIFIKFFNMSENFDFYTFYTSFNHVTIEIRILFKIIQSKISRGKYKLYYINYRYDEKVYNNIIHIIPLDNLITEYGLDQRYVVCGIFLNKVFEYKDQIDKTLLDGDSERAKVDRDTEYTFIGNFTNYNFLR